MLDYSPHRQVAFIQNLCAFENTSSLEFKNCPSLLASLSRWEEEKKTAVWLKVPIHRGNYIPIAARHGFLFHHAENDSATLYKWLDKNTPSRLPRFATHQVGVAGIKHKHVCI